MLDWFVNPDHAALVVAQEKGFFAAQNLEVELQTPADPNDPPKLVAAGKVDLAVSYQPQLMIHSQRRPADQADRHPGRDAVEFAGGAERTVR
jgi:ABC-type nitrate/sulfonate/bicarbonate transport system substrate-binding protein